MTSHAHSINEKLQLSSLQRTIH